MKTISEKRVAVHRLLYKLGALDSKADMLASYGVTSLTDLSYEQLSELTSRLLKAVNNRYDVPDNVRKWRSNVLTQLNRCGVYNTNNDWSDVNRFMLNPRIAGKLLYELDLQELQALCVKLRAIADKKEVEARNTVYNGIHLN